MFHYFGGKMRLAARYPYPVSDTIIEPFAGSAAYAMRYREHDVILIEKDPRIVRLWRYLQRATADDILALPLIDKGERVDGRGLSEAEEDLIRAHVAPGASVGLVAGLFSRWNISKRKEIAKLVGGVKHWTIIEGSYESAPDIVATWFIDPPYQFGGHRYRCGNDELNYPALWAWCEARLGQVIVCENDLNTWIPKARTLAMAKNIQNDKRREVYYERGSLEIELIGDNE